MVPSLLIVSALALGAPAAKDPPKKDPATIVGEWVGEKALAGGKDLPAPAGGVVFEFTKDGKAVIREGPKPPEPADYKADPSKDPAEIDLTPGAAAKTGTLLGIYRVEKDTLTVCFAVAGARPTKFESPDGSATLLMTFKRAKKKD
jgi:uncharacterized protein (TIGR03067 family)